MKKWQDSNNIGKSLKINSMIYMIRNIMNIIFPLITFKYAATVLKASGVGAINYSSAIVSYFGLIAQLGINTYAIAEGAKLRTKDKELNEFVNNMFSLNILSTIISYICLFITVFSVSGLSEYRILIAIYSLTIISTTIGFEWLFIILERFTYITVRSVLFQLVSIVLLFLLVKSESDTIWYAVLSVFASSGSGIVNYYYANKLVKIRLKAPLELKKYLKPVLVIWISNVASLIYINADTILLGMIKGDYEVGIYSAATKIIKAICVPITTICTVSAPSLAEGISQGKDNINKLTKKVVDFLSFFIFPCSIWAFLLSNEAILLLSGKDFLSGSIAEKILVIDIFLSPVNGFLVNQILIPAKKERISMIAMLIAAIFNIILDIILIPVMSFNGAAIATVVSEFIVLIVCLKHVRKIVNLRIICSDAYKYLLISLIIVPVWLALKCLSMNYLLFSFAVVAVSGMIYILVVKKVVKTGDYHK